MSENMVNSSFDRRSSLAPRKSIVLDTTSPEKQQQIYYVYQDQKYIYNISKDTQDNNQNHPAAEQYFNSLNYKNVKDKAQAKRIQMEEIDDETLILKRALLIKQHAAILKRNTNKRRTQEWLKEEENHETKFITSNKVQHVPSGHRNGVYQSIPSLKQPEWPGESSLEVLWNRSSRQLSNSLNRRSKSGTRTRPSLAPEFQRSRHDSYPLLPSTTTLTNQFSLPNLQNPYWQLGSPSKVRHFCGTNLSFPASRISGRKIHSAYQ
ncbi:hypothetical protein TrispH2_000470 [Trichoplax sp. H2]|nr:hypothetical protein TrispH2_000470 [Trichoplax sp. H2]|eukprot:RDD47881.1 hypothetical protein TrispH2_000470 [Trichoplax sp. H2]